MSQRRPQLPGRGGVLYGVGPFLRRCPKADHGNGGAVNASSPAAREYTSVPSHDVMLPVRSSADPQASGCSAQLFEETKVLRTRPTAGVPDSRLVEAEWIYAGQLDQYRRCSEQVQLLKSFVAQLSGDDGVVMQNNSVPNGTSAFQLAQLANTQASIMIPRAVQGASTASRKRRAKTSRPVHNAERKPAGWGMHKEYDDCSRSEKRKRDRAIKQLNIFWELHDKPVSNKLSILGDLQPTEAMLNKGKGLHEKPTIDNYFAQQFYQKDDRDCSSNFLTLLSRFAQLFCGDRRTRGLEILRRHANMRQTPQKGHLLFDIQELICDDIIKALKETALEKIILHPLQKSATKLDDMRSGISAIDEEGLEAMTWNRQVPFDLRLWIKNNIENSHKKLNELVVMTRNEQRKLTQLVQFLNGKVAAQMGRLPPREFPVLQDPREIQVEIAPHRPGQLFSYTVEFPGQEFTYEDVMKDEFSPNACEARIRFRLRNLKRRCKRQQRIVDKFVVQIHRRAMRCVGSGLISNTQAVNKYIHSRQDVARKLHRSLLKSARFKASVKLVQFHLRAQKMSFLHQIEWRGFERLDSGL